MYAQVLSVALCALFVTPVTAQFLIQDGDYYPRYEATGETLLMTGGQVDSLNIYIDHARIEGGTVGIPGVSGIRSQEGVFEILGGRISGGFNSGFRCTEGRCDLVFHGFDFRAIEGDTVENHNAGQVEGWLLDGSFISLPWAAAGGSDVARVWTRFELYPGGIPPLEGDTNADQVVNITDLNEVRNNFGSSGLGDLNQNGVVDIADLNAVRNAFGTDFGYTLGPEHQVPAGEAVPEPPSITLLAVAVAGVVAARRRQEVQ
jgi:hypothetical protein